MSWQHIKRKMKNPCTWAGAASSLTAMAHLNDAPLPGNVPALILAALAGLVAACLPGQHHR